MSKLFGGSDDSAQKAQIASNRETLALQDRLAQQARGDVLGLTPGIRESQRQGFQGALDLLAQTVPQQAQAFQAGNVNAQQTLTNALPQIQNAILGNAIDNSVLRPAVLPIDTSFVNQQLPEMADIAQPAPQLNAIQKLLAGGIRF